MKKKLLTMMMATIATAALAYDFQVDDIYYNIKNGNEAIVTYETTNYKSYSGDVVIPEAVSYDSTIYVVTEIGANAFRSCTGLTSITISNSVTAIREWAFQNCSGLTSIIIPNSVTSIGTGAFIYCSGMTSVTIGNSVTTIGIHSFYDCNSLTSIVVANDNPIYDSRDNCNAIIQTATNTLFAGCKNSTIPNSVTAIGEKAFSDCRSLTSITIPNSVTSIGKDAFHYCIGLTSIDIPNSVTSIGTGAFEECSGLISLTIGKSVTSIGMYAFSRCRHLNSITIPNSVTVIDYGAFRECSGLTSLTIGNSITSIGDFAFQDCSGLNEIYSLSVTPPTVGTRTFYNCYGATLYVPITAVGNYQAAEYWKQFAHIEGWGGAEPGDINGDGFVTITDVTNLIDMLLGGDELPAWADVDGDGSVSIKDVTTLIDMLLGGQ